MVKKVPAWAGEPLCWMEASNMLEVDKRKKKDVNKEIDAIIKSNGGMINKSLLVEQAQVEGSALHEDFKKRGLFDSDKAMRFAQMTYAGILITQYKVWVNVEDRDPVKVRALVSLTPERKKEGCYRPIITVMHDDDMRKTLLEDAKKELSAFKNKYAVLSELAPVFSAIDGLK